MPAALEVAPGRLPLIPGFRVVVADRGDARLLAGVERALARLSRRTGVPPVLSGSAAGAALEIECAGAGRAVPRLGDDESYTLDITPARAVLRAPNTVGALRGLETLLQLAQSDAGGWFFPAVSVRDAPRFPWRGLLIDVAHHAEPVEVIERNLDGMALVKLNVLHLHLTDDQGFRVESRTHPELHERGSDGKFFTQAQIRGIIAYAAARGIRVVPEFDVPGHSTSWVVSHPELASAPGPYALEHRWGVCDPVLDPTNEQTYALLENFFGEMAALFPDEFIHIGGDENNGRQWSANARIQAFIRERGLVDNAGLHAYFNRRVADILRRQGKRLIGWDEILHPDLPSDSVVHSWRGPTGLAEAVARGFAVVLSHGYYIDLNQPAAEHYAVDPLPAGTPLTPAQQRLVLGGEATMWAEWVTPDNIDTRIWPRTAAIAERLWSPREVRDIEDMYRRLDVIDRRLQETGVQSGAWPRFDPLPAPVAGALTTLASVVEPVKHYQRGGRQPDYGQLTPLDDLADWALPESRPAREFAAAVERWLLAPGVLDAAQSAAFAATFESWRAAGELAATTPAAGLPGARARPAVARALAAVSRAGLDSLAALQQGASLAPDRLAAAREALAAAAQPTAAAVEFPFLPAVRLLVAAAADPAARAELPREVWRRRLESASLSP